jgi:hypothetical protein
MGAVLNEVISPDVIRALRPQTDAEPSVSHRRPRLGCLAGTLSPSRRQIRSTRFLFTTQPAVRSKAVIRR